jgi:mercuric ion binding protein
MKKLQMTIFALLGLIMVSFAQQKAVQKTVIKTPTVQCDMCKDKIEKYLFRTEGVTAAKVDVKKKTTTVTYITDRTNVENIKAAIANAGYDADDVAAEESAYKKLPACCKKPAAETKQ